MDYIINPMWFYWLQLIGNIGTFFTIIAVCTGVATLIAFMFIHIELCGWDDPDAKNFKKVIRICSIVCAVSILIALLLPTKETLISMMTAKFTTKDNAQLTLDGLKSAVDYIITGIKQLK